MQFVEQENRILSNNYQAGELIISWFYYAAFSQN